MQLIQSLVDILMHNKIKQPTTDFFHCGFFYYHPLLLIQILLLDEVFLQSIPRLTQRTSVLLLLPLRYSVQSEFCCSMWYLRLFGAFCSFDLVPRFEFSPCISFIKLPLLFKSCFVLKAQGVPKFDYFYLVMTMIIRITNSWNR